MERNDAVVVGSGHNGLVAAAYLARAGLRTVVLERSERIGGATATEEIAPGIRSSVASYAFSLFRPDVYRELGLAGHGLVFHPKDPQTFVPLPDGRHFFIWRDASRTAEEIGRIHPPDADGYRRWSGFWKGAVDVLRPLIDDPSPPLPEDLRTDLERRGHSEVWRWAVEASAAEVTERFFASDEIRGTFATQGIIGTFAPPTAPGTAWVMAYHFLGGELAGEWGTWCFVEGGMGAVAASLASAARSAGVEIRCDAEVDEVMVLGEKVEGVRLTGGEEVPARSVMLGVEPSRALSGLLPAGALPDDWQERLDSWVTQGCVVKVGLAVTELPVFTALPGPTPGPQHRGTINVAPSIAYLEEAFADAESGRYSTRPFMEVFVESVNDPSLIDDKGHAVSIFTQYSPLDHDDPAALREEALRNVIDTLAAYAPNIEESVLGARVLVPHDLEQRFGLTGGDIFHGSILPHQSFGARFPYRTPISGLYLGGSGTSPGGGVMGSAGRNAALALLSDLSSP